MPNQSNTNKQPVRECDKKAAKRMVDYCGPEHDEDVSRAIDETRARFAQIIADTMAEERQRFDLMANCIFNDVSESHARMAGLWVDDVSSGCGDGDNPDWLLKASHRHEDNQ